MTETKSTIVIPNFNGRRFLATCLGSIARQTRSDVHTIVVDNGSEDGSVPWMEKHYPEVQVIALEENQGFSKAVNVGVRAAATEYIMLLNNDTELDANFVAAAIGALEQYPSYHVIAPKMVAFHERNILDGAGDGVFRGGGGYRIGTKEEDCELFDRPREVFGACAGAAIFRQSFFSEVGLFDESFFAYLEDVDINHRANLRGLKTLYLPTAIVYHIGSATTGSSLNDFTVRQTTRNLIAVVIKNYPRPLLVKFSRAIVGYQLWWLLVALKGGHPLAYLAGLAGALGCLPQLRKKRAENLGQARIDHRQYARLIQESETQVLMSIRRRRRKKNQMVWPLAFFGKI